MSFASIILSVVLVLFGFAGGGGSSSGGGSSGGGYSGGSSSYHSSGSSSSSNGGDSIDSLIIFTIVFFVIIYVIFSSKKHNKLINSHNSTPQEKWINEESIRIFKNYQKDWTDLNEPAISAYTTPDYHEHAALMLELLKNLHRINKVSKLTVHGSDLHQPISEHTPLPIDLRITFDFSGRDQVIDTNTQKILYDTYVSHATETWNFIYDGKTLKLSGISQPTESSPHLIRSLADFAAQHQLFYSPDWGRYALPSRGLIFGGSSMKISDINNHIIGKWGDSLIQLYTYSEVPNQPSAYYLVGQINVPKEYLGVIVKSKKYKSSHKPDKSYEKFEMEWPDFNKRYEVYTARRDALPAFELLNPKFMEYLYNKNPNYNLEVVDNVIYIFANIKDVTEKDYADLLDVLAYAHKELKI